MKWYQKLGLYGGIFSALAMSNFSCSRVNLEQVVDEPVGIEQVDITEANKQLRGFPIEIPGAERVEKYETPNASYCLVQIKQIHNREPDFSGINFDEMPPENRKFLEAVAQQGREEIRAKAKASQKNIYSILSSLIDRQGLLQVYLEGVAEEEDVKTVLGAYKQLELSRSYLSEAGRNIDAIRGKVPKEKLEKILATYEQLRKSVEKFEEEKYVHGAVPVLASEGKLRILIAEDPIIYEAAESDLGNEYLKMDAREDALLKIIEERQDNFAITVYGADHNFRDNINRWNSKNPNRSFSLIEVYLCSN